VGHFFFCVSVDGALFVCRMHILHYMHGRSLGAYLWKEVAGVALEWVLGPKAVWWVVVVVVVLDSHKLRLYGATKGVALDRCRLGS
jgi:hypothetical protein